MCIGLLQRDPDSEEPEAPLVEPGVPDGRFLVAEVVDRAVPPCPPGGRERPVPRRPRRLTVSPRSGSVAPRGAVEVATLGIAVPWPARATGPTGSARMVGATGPAGSPRMVGRRSAWATRSAGSARMIGRGPARAAGIAPVIGSARTTGSALVTGSARTTGSARVVGTGRRRGSPRAPARHGYRRVPAAVVLARRTPNRRPYPTPQRQEHRRWCPRQSVASVSWSFTCP